MADVKEVFDAYETYLEVLGNYLGIEKKLSVDISGVRSEFEEYAEKNDYSFVDRIMEDVIDVQKSLTVLRFLTNSIGGIYHE